MFKPLFFKFAICIAVMLILGSLAGWMTTKSLSDWYVTLEKPPGTPPKWLFGPVWTILYLMIAASFALIWHRVPGQPGKTRLTFLFALQLAFNLAWTPIFFGAHQIEAAFGVLLILSVAIALTIREFSKHLRPAALLLVPYFFWVLYAGYLNLGFALLN